jgi:hypothetical protein
MSTAAPASQGKRALLVGIDTYPKLGTEFQLRGAVRDAERFGDLLCRNFGFPAANVALLRNEEAVHDQVLGAMRRLADATNPDDVVVFYFSGHGSQRTDLENDEDDGYDETILPFDSGRGSTVANRDITDDEIYLWLRDLGAKTSNITLVFDCCNSGNLTRAPFEGTNRMAPRDDRPASELPPSPIPREEWTALARANQKKASAGWLPIGEKYVMIAACRDDQKAGEYPPGAADVAEVHGCLTYFMLQELATAGPGTTYRDVFEPTRRRVTAVYPEQVPQLEGNRDRILFGATDLDPVRYLTVTERSAQTVTLDGGQAYAVRTGSRWVVYPAGTKRPESPTQRLGEVEISATRGLSSSARIDSESASGAIAIGARAFLLDPGMGIEPMAVRLAQSPERSLGPYRALADELSRSPQLRLAPDGDAAPYEVVLLGPRGNPGPHDRVPDAGPVTAPAWAIVATGDRLVAPPQPAPSVGAVRTDLETIARYHDNLKLRNPASPLADKVDVVLFRSREGGEWEPARPEADGKILYHVGDRLAFRVINRWQTDLYLNVLEFAFTYRVWLVYPPARGANEMARRIPPLEYGRLPNQVLKFLPMPAWFARDEGYETLKFILADGEIDYSWMQQEGVGPRARGLEEWSTLEIDLVIRRS